MLVYINYIVENINSHIFDASSFRTVDEVSLHEDTRLLNEDLNRISLWANQWKITISIPKTIAMIFSRKKQPPQELPLILNNNGLKNVKQHKHLGITFTQNWQWTTHIDNIVSSATTRIHLMKIVKYKCSRNSLLSCYTNFIRPLIEYANVVYENLSIQDCNKLENIQNEAMRIIAGAKRLSSNTALLKETGFKTLAKSHKMIVFFQMYSRETAITYINRMYAHSTQIQKHTSRIISHI